MAAIWKGVESLKRSWTFFVTTFPYTETSPEMTSSSRSFKSGSSNIVKSAMRASKEGGYAASSTGGGSSGDVVAFPFPLPTMSTNRGDVPRGLPLSLYLPKEGGRSLLLNTTTVLQGKTPFILNCGDSNPRGLPGGLPRPRDKGSSTSLGRPLRRRAAAARTRLPPSAPSASLAEPACHDGEERGARSLHQRPSPRVAPRFGPRSPPEFG